MYTDDNDLMVKALSQQPKQEGVWWDNDEFKPNNDYPIKQQEYQHLSPVEQALFYGVPRPELLKMAGDVMPMYIPGTEPADAGRHQMESAAYAWGNKTAPTVSSIGLPTMKQWLDNARLKASGK